MKLPKLSPPHFSGNVTKWTTFWDSFESAVHNNDDLTDVDKFNYLRSLLELTAYEAISGLTLSSANYREAVDVLHKRFGDKQLIISKHMETLLSIEAVTSEQNVRGLCRLHDDVESHIKGLKSLGVAPESYGALLSPVLLSKLSPELRFFFWSNLLLLSANPLLNRLHLSAQRQRMKADPQNKWSLFQLPQEGSHWS